MRVYQTLTVDMNKPIGNGRFEVVFEDSFEHIGDVAECKKGREAMDTAAAGANNAGAQATDISKQNQGIQTGYRNQSDPFGKSLLPSANGSLSPYAAAQLGQQKRDIGKTYGDIAQVGIRGLGARGMGNAPTGMASSLYNTAGRNAGEAETNAYSDAMKNTLNQGLAGLQYSQGQQGLYDPLNAIKTSTGAYGAGAEAGSLRNKAGSLMSDIGGGLSGLAGIASKFVKPVPA